MADEVFRELWHSQPASRNNPHLRDLSTGPPNLNRLKTAVNEIYAEARRKPIMFPCLAMCLYADVVTLTPGNNTMPEYQVDRALGRTIKIIEVVAHVPRLDSLLTVPQVTSLEDMGDWDLWNLMLHAAGDRIFRAQLYGEEGKAGGMPSPGDTISVDFRDRKGRQGPLYVGRKRRALGLIPPASSTDTTSTSELFDVSGEPTPMAEYSTSDAEQEAEQLAAVNDKLDEYAAEWAADTGVSEAVARGYLEKTLGLPK